MTQGATPIREDLDAEAQRLLAEVDRLDVHARLIGGMAVRILAGERLHPVYDRPVGDLDFVVVKRHAHGLDRLLLDAGYAPDDEFNALNGHRRLLFRDDLHGRQIDVFVERFEMCHRLPLAERIMVQQQTLPAAEVLMTKLQIIDLNAKDRGDLYAILHSHDIAEHDDDAVNSTRIAELTANDWGLQHTFERTLDRLRAGLGEQPLIAADLLEVERRIDALATAMEQAPKSRKWRLRAKVGERKQWYDEPEEVVREG